MRAWSVAFLVLALSYGFAAAQSYPDRRINLVVPVPAGSVADILARSLTAGAADQFHIENVAEGVSVGTERAARAAPDGYTLLFRWHGFVPQGLTGVSLVATAPLVLVADPRFGPGTLQDVISTMRSRPNEVRIASAGSGTTSHYAIETFARNASVRPIHVPFRGGAEGLAGVLAGEASLSFQSVQASLPQITAGKLRALAVTGTSRNYYLQQVPTFGEAGVGGMWLQQWFGVFAPAGTPEDVIEAAGQLILRAAVAPAFQEQLGKFGYDSAALKGRDVDQFVAAELGPDTQEPPDCCKSKACIDLRLCPRP